MEANVVSSVSNRRKIMQYVLIGVYLCLTVAGLVFMKLGGNPGSLEVKDGTVTLGMSIISGIGLVCYLCSFLLFTRVVIMFDLSYIYPIVTGIVQILTLVASALVFKEHMTAQSVIGAIIIIVGIIIMNFKKA